MNSQENQAFFSQVYIFFTGIKLHANLSRIYCTVIKSSQKIHFLLWKILIFIRERKQIYSQKKNIKHFAFIIWPWCHRCWGISCFSCLPPLRFDMKSFCPQSKEYIAFDRLLQSTISFGWRTYQMQYTGIMKLLNFNCR